VVDEVPGHDFSGVVVEIGEGITSQFDGVGATTPSDSLVLAPESSPWS